MPPKPASVLVVDDERELADLYTAWLEADYDVSTAYGGQSALEAVDASTDVVILDRRMPGVGGDEVLERTRARKLKCHVAMVTAVEPDFDILDMGFDDYEVKPVDREDLHGLVERMLAFDEIGPGAKRYYAQLSKKSALEEQKLAEELAANAEFSELSAGVETYGKTVIALAEDAIRAIKHKQLSPDHLGKRVELQDWENKLESLDPDDPLNRVARERVEELKAESDGEGDGAKERFLETIADEFIAENHWIDPTVRRAINLALYDRDREKVIINREALTDLAQRDTKTKFDVSQDVRKLAKDELSSLV